MFGALGNGPTDRLNMSNSPGGIPAPAPGPEAVKSTWAT